MWHNSITVLWPDQLKTFDVSSPPGFFEVEKDLVYSSIAHVFYGLIKQKLQTVTQQYSSLLILSQTVTNCNTAVQLSADTVTDSYKL